MSPALPESPESPLLFPSSTESDGAGDWLPPELPLPDPLPLPPP
ncbi:hypothetical protein AB0X62_01305 [Ligilactobacillus salivarius]